MEATDPAPNPPPPPAAPPAVPDSPAPAAPAAEAPPLPPVAAEFATEPPPLPPSAPVARFSFHGDAREFFRIWIVNTLLTLLTLGIFSAWAKVRKRRYLRGHTELLGRRFDYTADPRRLLVGNLIVVTLFLAYALVGSVYVPVRIGAFLLFVVLLPWIVVRSLAFNAHHTVYRGLRFRFHPSLSAAALIYLAQPLLIVLSLGFYYPVWARNRQQFVLGRHRFGTAYFDLTLPAGALYRAYLAGGGIVFAAALVGGGIVAALTWANSGHVPTGAQLLPAFALYGFGAFLAKQLIFAESFRLIWNEARLDRHRFRTSLETGPWVKLQLVNLGAMIVTCGLAYPWALVRSTEHVLSRLEVLPDGPVDAIESLEAGRGSAVGDTAAEFAGMDFGL